MHMSDEAIANITTWPCTQSQLDLSILDSWEIPPFKQHINGPVGHDTLSPNSNAGPRRFFHPSAAIR